MRARLEDAVERRLVADVPLGAFLSGGIDSSAVVGLMAGLIDRPVQTFTIGFEDRDGYDERPYARSWRSGTAPTTTSSSCSPTPWTWSSGLVWHHDQPFGDSSAIPTFLLSELTRGHVTVALSGDGGDELFAGYERFAAGLAARALRRPARAAPAATTAGAVGLLPAGALRWPRRRACSASRASPSGACPTPTARWISSSSRRTATRCSTAGATTGGSRTTARSGRARRARTRSTACSTSTCAPTCSTTCS